MNKESESNTNTGAEGPPKVWVVVVTKPQQERLARLNLENQGYEPYLPMKLSMNLKTKALVATPFFPGYLFALTGLTQSDWAPIWSTRGVKGVLASTASGRPLGVAAELIGLIRAHEEDGYLKIGLEGEGPRFTRGERVALGDGLMEFEGVFQERVDANRARILCNFLGRASRFVVDLRKLRSLS